VAFSRFNYQRSFHSSICGFGQSVDILWSGIKTTSVGGKAEMGVGKESQRQGANDTV
jgi:hypothetical protein